MERIEKLRREIGKSAKNKGVSLLGDGLGESGRLDRAVLDRQIQEILQEASLNPVSAAALADQLDAFVACAHRGDVPRAATHVPSLLSRAFDDLLNAALPSLLLRLSRSLHLEPLPSPLLLN